MNANEPQFSPEYVQPAFVPPNSDAEHLRLLSIFHYVYAGVAALFACFPLIYVVMGIAIMSGQIPFGDLTKEHAAKNPAPLNPAPLDPAPLDPVPGNGVGNQPRPDDARNADDLARKRFEDEFGEESRFIGMIFAVVGSGFVLLGWIFAALVAVAGRKLAKRRGRTFCMVIAALCCLMVPFGTILGVFTLIVLSRPSVQALFAAPVRMQPW